MRAGALQAAAPLRSGDGMSASHGRSRRRASPDGRPQPPATPSIALSLVSHTNVGKTTLARTLLGRDIGEVRDAPHVTEFADVHTMLESPEGDRSSSGTRRASATASACCGGCASRATRSAGS